MSFERIDRAFRPKLPRIVLECVSCGTPDRVSMLYPLWVVPGERVEQPLCPACSRRSVPLQ